jgi:hypothetical protein
MSVGLVLLHLRNKKGLPKEGLQGWGYKGGVTIRGCNGRVTLEGLQRRGYKKGYKGGVAMEGIHRRGYKKGLQWKGYKGGVTIRGCNGKVTKEGLQRKGCNGGDTKEGLQEGVTKKGLLRVYRDNQLIQHGHRC